MTNEVRAIIKWLKENVLTAYQEPVSSKASLPYISLSSAFGGFNDDSLQQLTIWTRSDGSYESAYHYADLISAAIGDQGVIITNGDTRLYLTKGSPFSQNRLDDTTTIRAVLVNVIIKNLNN